MKRIAEELFWTAVYSGLSGATVGNVLGVEYWKAVAVAAAVGVLHRLRKIAAEHIGNPE